MPTATTLFGIAKAVDEKTDVPDLSHLASWYRQMTSTVGRGDGREFARLLLDTDHRLVRGDGSSCGCDGPWFGKTMQRTNYWHGHHKLACVGNSMLYSAIYSDAGLSINQANDAIMSLADRLTGVRGDEWSGYVLDVTQTFVSIEPNPWWFCYRQHC